jgi:hypothetical protein
MPNNLIPTSHNKFEGVLTTQTNAQQKKNQFMTGYLTMDLAQHNSCSMDCSAYHIPKSKH